MAWLAVDLDMPARLFHKPIHHAEPESGPLALWLRREERLKDMLDHIWRDSAAGVGHGEHHILARDNFGVTGGIGVVEKSIAGFYGELAMAVHRIAGIDRKIEQGVLDLNGVDKRVPQPAGDHGFDLDAFAKRAAQHVVDAAYQAARSITFGASGCRRPKARSCEASFDPREIAAIAVCSRCSPRRLPGHVARQKLQIAANDLQDVVEIVRHAAGEFADRFHLLRLTKLIFGLSPLSDRCGDSALEDFIRLLEDLLGFLPRRDVDGGRDSAQERRRQGGEEASRGSGSWSRRRR